MGEPGDAVSTSRPFGDLARGPVFARADFWLESASHVKSLIDDSLMSGLRAADAELFDAALDSAPARLKLPDPVVVEPQPWGEPGAVCANLLSSWEPTGRGRTLRHRDGPLTRRRMDWIVDPERELPFAVRVNMSRLDHRGVPAGSGLDGRAHNPDYFLTCTVLVPDRRETDTPPGWAVTVTSRLASVGGEPTEQRLRWVRELAARPGFRYAEVGWTRDRPSFEQVHGPRRFEASRIYMAEQAARGYNWVTVLPRTLARQISASRREEAEAALFEVADLPGGALWARGSERFQGFYESRLPDMFRLCSEVLPTGPMKPVAPLLPTMPAPVYPVVYEDAALHGSTLVLPPES